MVDAINRLLSCDEFFLEGEAQPYHPPEKSFAVSFSSPLDWIYVCICEGDQNNPIIRTEYHRSFNNNENVTIRLPENLLGLKFQIIGFYSKQQVGFSVGEAIDLLNLDTIELQSFPNHI